MKKLIQAILMAVFMMLLVIPQAVQAQNTAVNRIITRQYRIIREYMTLRNF